MGAFLLRPDLECSGHFTLYMSTQCGVIPYKIYTNQKAKYCFEVRPICGGGLYICNGGGAFLYELCVTTLELGVRSHNTHTPSPSS